MSWDTNIYYNPEKNGLTQIDMLSDPDASWSFDDLIVWQHEDGRIFYASDSGCSCPSPFEDFNSLEDLNKVTDTQESWDAFQDAVMNHCKPWRDEAEDKLAADRTEMLRLVATKLGENK